MDKKYNNYSPFNILVVCFLSILSFFAFIALNKYVPRKFLYDSFTIRNGMLDPNGFGKSFSNTIKFFKFFGMNYSTPIIVINLFSWVVFIIILISFIRFNKYINFSVYQLIFITFFSLMYWLYFTHYSKDIIVIILFLIAINLPKINQKLLINIILIIGIYGLYFRSYWLVVFFISIILLILNKNKKITHNILYIILAFIIFIIIFNLTKNNQVTNLRISFNGSRIGTSYAQSIINNLYPNSSFISDIINYLYVLISLFIPIQGFPSLNVIIYYLWIWGLVFLFIKYRKNVNIKLLLIFFIYINVQALFEPDFGSVLRHQLSWAPVIYYCYYNVPIKNIITKTN